METTVEAVTLTVPWDWLYYVAITAGILVYLLAGLAVAPLLLRLDRTMPTEVGFILAVAWPITLIVLVLCVTAWVFDRLLRRFAGREEGDS